MGLSGAMARLAGLHLHALVVGIPGHWRLRVEAERVVLGRGWRLAASPADADILIVCGPVGEQLAGAVDLAWAQMPGPRVRVELMPGEDVNSQVSQAATLLLDTSYQRRDAAQRGEVTDLLQEAGDHDHEQAADHAGMDHDHMEGDHMDHGEMDHGDMEMAPGGLALAEGGPDRDGLEMDVLHLALGPVLVHWPAGLVVRCALQGDVVIEAGAELLDVRHEVSSPAVRARQVDGVTTLLTLAGWEAAAARAREVRDLLLDNAAGAESKLIRLERRIRRSRVLRWSLRGLGPLGGEDAYDRLLGMVTHARGGQVDSFGLSTAGQLAGLITGVDLAAARLIVASLDLHGLGTDDTPQGVAHA